MQIVINCLIAYCFIFMDMLKIGHCQKYLAECACKPKFGSFSDTMILWKSSLQVHYRNKNFFLALQVLYVTYFILSVPLKTVAQSQLVYNHFDSYPNNLF